MLVRRVGSVQKTFYSSIKVTEMIGRVVKSVSPVNHVKILLICHWIHKKIFLKSRITSTKVFISEGGAAFKHFSVVLLT